MSLKGRAFATNALAKAQRELAEAAMQWKIVAGDNPESYRVFNKVKRYASGTTMKMADVINWGVRGVARHDLNYLEQLLDIQLDKKVYAEDSNL